MRIPLHSPFSPGSDSVPQVWAGRTAQLCDWQQVVRPRRLAGIAERGRTILGEAGMGKSSLVRRIAADARQRGDWVTPQLRIPAGTDPLQRLAAALLELADAAGLSAGHETRLGKLFARVESIAAAGVSVTLRDAGTAAPYTSLTELLVEIGRAAAKRGDVVVLIHIDEVQNIASEEALSQLLIALGDALTFEDPVIAPGGVEIDRALPIAVYLTGLPEFEDRAGSRMGATFARRFQTTTLTALDDDDLVAALHTFVGQGWEVPDEEGGTELITMEPAAAAAIADLCCGEPFLFQLAGERAWFAGTGNVITEAEAMAGWQNAKAEARSHVERILARLPQREREFVEAMAELPPEDRTLTRIADRLGGLTATAAGPTAQRLDSVRGIISRGKPYSFRHRAVEAHLASSWPDVSGSRPQGPSTAD
ncbi:ATP-binding protein [Brevibacterium luteolum]|uniref:ATP-binding protein n=1 Tax=Brevibacterium luteolum TaxID=199591 RepID=UPI003EE9D081